MKCQMAADQVLKRFSRQIRKEDAFRTKRPSNSPEFHPALCEKAIDSWSNSSNFGRRSRTGVGTWKHDLLRFGGKRWDQPAKKNSGGKSAEELGGYKTGRIQRTNPGKRIRERSGECYRWIGVGSGCSEPICARYV